jgi:hypothetical protein
MGEIRLIDVVVLPTTFGHLTKDYDGPNEVRNAKTTKYDQHEPTPSQRRV